MNYYFNKYKQPMIFAMIFLALGYLSGFIANISSMNWYYTINKPTFNPPGWIFGPVWTILYIFIGITAHELYTNERYNKNLFYILIFHFCLNLIWSPLFFFFNRIDFALITLIGMWLTLGFIVFKTMNNKKLLFLLSPYLLWISFALILNWNIYILN